MIETETVRDTPQATRPPPRIGFAGVGRIGRRRLEAILESGCAEITAIYDPVSGASDSAVQLAPKASVARSFDEMLALDLDGVAIATPNALHAPQALAALLRNKAVFCQKPLGRDATETREIIAVARETNRLLHIDLSYRFTSGLQRIRQLIRSGALGRIYAVEGVFHNAYGPDRAWFYDAQQSGGGCLLDLGIHLVDLTLWCLDYPQVNNVVGHLLNREPAPPDRTHRVEDYAAAQLLLGNGASVQLACSWHAPAGCDAEIRVTFFGSGGGATFANVDGSFFDFTALQFQPDRSRHTLVSPPDAWGGRAAVEWCRRLRQSAGFDPEIEHLGTVAETLDRIYGRLT